MPNENGEIFSRKTGTKRVVVFIGCVLFVEWFHSRPPMPSCQKILWVYLEQGRKRPRHGRGFREALSIHFRPSRKGRNGHKRLGLHCKELRIISNGLTHGAFWIFGAVSKAQRKEHWFLRGHERLFLCLRVVLPDSRRRSHQDLFLASPGLPLESLWLMDCFREMNGSGVRWSG